MSIKEILFALSSADGVGTLKEASNIAFAELSKYCDEYLIHAVDVEGKASGIEEELAAMLGSWGRIPMTYAGGVGNFRDLSLLRDLGKDKLDVTVGSALDIFGGDMNYDEVIRFCKK